MSENNSVAPHEAIPPRANRIARLIPWVATLLVFAPQLLFSSPEHRLFCWLAACLIATYYAGRPLMPLLRSLGGTGVMFCSGIVIVHLASWLGGVYHGDPWWLTSALGLAGLVGVAGVAVFLNTLMEPRWIDPLKRIGIGLLVLLLAGSFVGYFLSIERFINAGEFAKYIDFNRMMLVWPTRLLTMPIGQICWEHTNYAAFYFALSLLMILEHLANGGKGRHWWWLCGLLTTAVFLTASRGGWLMVVAALPLILVRRRFSFSLKTLGLLGVSISLGFACLKLKIAAYPPVNQQPAYMIAIHGSALVERGSAGRITGYQTLWYEQKGARFCGNGLAVCGTKVDGHEHEHSIFFATLRGGGVVGLAGHLLVIGSAAWAALALLRRGQRWPAVLLVTVISGLLFDRSTVFAISGNYEFIAHWVAVLLPLILSARGNVRHSA